MNNSDFREQARRRAADAAQRLTETRVALEEGQRQAAAPVPGDLYVFEQTADCGLQWVVIESDPEGEGSLRVVAGDLNREVGSADVAISGQDGGVLTVRCRIGARLPAAVFDPRRRTGQLATEDLDRVHRKRQAISADALHLSTSENEIESECVYEDLVRELTEARDALVAIAGGEAETAGTETAGTAETTAETAGTESIKTGKAGEVSESTVLDTETAIHWSGLDAVTGDRLINAFLLAEAARTIQAEVQDRFLVELLRRMHRARTQPTLSLPDGISGVEIERAGWALVVHAEEPAEVRAALAPLIEHRRQAGGPVAVLEVREGEDWREWLARHGVAAGDRLIPEKVPYFLLLVGSPRRVSFELQRALQVQYAVGRISLEQPQDYRRYAESVIASEVRNESWVEPRAVFFAPRDRAPRGRGEQDSRDVDGFVEPLAAELVEQGTVDVVRLLGSAATRSRLIEVLSEANAAPTVMLAAAHGLGWRTEHDDQVVSQGALICQDWPGNGPVEPHHVLSARDVPADTNLANSMMLFVSSFGAGTPAQDHGEAFVAGLPQRLLSHPGGSALAVVGMVDRAATFNASLASDQRRWWRVILTALLDGQPVGHALRELIGQQASAALELEDLRRKASFGAPISDHALVDAWLRHHQASSTIVLGDPAARLPVDGGKLSVAKQP